MTRRMPVWLAAYALLGGLVSLTGWIIDRAVLTDWIGSGISIQPNATLCVIFTALSILCLQAGQRVLARAASAVVIFLAGLTLAEWLGGWSFAGFDQWLMFGREWGRVGVIHPGRMGPPGSLSWTLLGLGLWLSSGPRPPPRAVPVVFLVTMLISAHSLVGYLYGVDQLYTLPKFSVIALQTSTFVMATSLAALMLHPQMEPVRTLLDDGGAGLIARRTLPLMLLVPIALGWLRELGRAAGWYGAGLGTAMLVLAMIAFLVALMWWALRAVRVREERERAALAELRQADQRKTEFLAMLAHELRNPLAPIRTSLDVLKATRDPAALDKVRVIMDRQVNHMVRLVDDLLDVSRITRGKPVLRVEPVDLRDVVATAVESSKPWIEAAKVELTVDLPAEPVRHDVDPVRLAQVLGNLLHNACKFTPPGGTVGVSLRRGAEGVFLTVRDNGMGVPPADQSAIFELFMQSGASMSRVHGGLGIGLALSRKLVELHGGQLTVRSAGTPGLGAEFLIHLPAGGDSP